jgi:hypothetical protein
MQNESEHLYMVADSDGAAILDIEQGVVTRLTSTGGIVWERLRQHFSLDQIAQEIATNTGAELETVRRDVQCFVADLAANGLLDN